MRFIFIFKIKLLISLKPKFWHMLKKKSNFLFILPSVSRWNVFGIPLFLLNGYMLKRNILHTRLHFSEISLSNLSNIFAILFASSKTATRGKGEKRAVGLFRSVDVSVVRWSDIIKFALLFSAQTFGKSPAMPVQKNVERIDATRRIDSKQRLFRKYYTAASIASCWYCQPQVLSAARYASYKYSQLLVLAATSTVSSKYCQQQVLPAASTINRKQNV